MDTLSEISDQEFISFLKSLGVHSYGKSFEWLLTDPNFYGVLSWLYDNFDLNNALTDREEYRYNEIQKAGLLLPEKEIEDSIQLLLEEYPGLSLPGDSDSEENVRQQIDFARESINFLEQNEEVITRLTKRNELSIIELSRDLNRFNAEEKQCREELANASAECLALAAEVQDITENAVDIVANVLGVYANASINQDLSKKFFMFGPFEAYKQSQSLFRSHLDLYTSTKINKKCIDTSEESDEKFNLKQAKDIEQRLNKTINSFIESAAELSGVNAMLNVVVNYENVHPTKIPVTMMECKNAVEILEREEEIVSKQVEEETRRYCQRRTNMAGDVAASLALSKREEIYNSMCWIHSAANNALALDRLLVHALRHELQSAMELLSAASHLQQHLTSEQAACVNRIESMTKINLQRQKVEQDLEKDDKLIEILCEVFDVNPSHGFVGIIEKRNDIKNKTFQLLDDIENELVNKEEALNAFKSSAKSLVEYVSDGCTRLPNSVNRGMASLIHTLHDKMAAFDVTIRDTTSLYLSIKEGDKICARKLWQWFLTDRSRLLSKLKEVQAISYY